MPLLNGRGDIVYGGTYVAIKFNNREDELPYLVSNHADLGAWYNEYTVAFQYGLDIQPVAEVKLSTGEQLNNFGASQIWAGGNRCIVNYGDSLYEGNNKIGTLVNKAGVGSDGSLVKQSYNYAGVIGPGFTSNDIATCFHNIDHMAMLWTLGTDTVKFWNGFLVLEYKVNISINYARIFICNGEVYILYNGDYLYIHKLSDRTRGWKITGATYNADAITVDGNIKVCWSSTQGETNESIGFSWINPAQPMEPFDSIIAPKEVNWPRKAWCADFFSISHRYGSTPPSEYQGNCAITVDETGLAEICAPRGLPIVTGKVSYDPAYDNLTIGYLIDSGSLSGMENQYHEFDNMPRKPITCYLDNRGWPANIPSFFDKNRTWLGARMYRELGEPLADYKRSVDEMLNRLDSYKLPIILVTQAYDRNGQMPISQVVEIQNFANEWVNKHYVIGIWPFADRRPGGIQSYPVLKPYVNAQFKNSIRPTRWDYWSTINKETTKQHIVNCRDTLTSDEKAYLIRLVDNA